MKLTADVKMQIEAIKNPSRLNVIDYLSLPESRGRREKGKFPSYFQNARFVE